MESNFEMYKELTIKVNTKGRKVLTKKELKLKKEAYT